MPVAKLLSRTSMPLGLVVGGLSLALFSAPAAATLHGYCAPLATMPPTAQCIDNGTNSPTVMNPPAGFGFTTSPGPSSGDLFVDVLVPNTVTNPSSLSFALTGTVSRTASLFNPTAWTGGALDAYLGISASPNNPIGAYLPATKALDPGASGFFVYQADLGTMTLQGASNPNKAPLENISPGLAIGSYIVGFFHEATGIQATANSGAIFVKGSPSSVPEPASLLLLVTGLAGLGISRRRRRAE